MNDLRRPIAHIGALLVLLAGLLFAVHRETLDDVPLSQTTTTTALETVSATSTATTTPTATIASSSPQKKDARSASTSTVQIVKKPSIQATKSASTASPNEIARIERPYSTPPLPFESVNIAARAALVNILCTTGAGGALKPISGSGMVIDARGIVLTNAHVAQYVLIAQSGKTDLQCTLRTGAPATARWIPVVLYIPSIWIDQHASDIIAAHPVGTGEHDYALLYIASALGTNPLPVAFAAVPPDSREAIGFVDDSVLAASYPVEFVGGGVIQNDLYPVSSIATIQQLLTFTTGSADAISLGGIIGAQSGSSGGGVVNQWGKLIGLITTTSDGATTGARDLHAITTGYINRDLTAQTGKNLTDTLAADPKTTADAFRETADTLAQKLIDVILRR